MELLRRTTRKVSLSLDGSDFLPYAREILAQASAARAILGGHESGPKGTLRFAAPSSFAQRHIMPLLPKFHALYPDLTLDLRLSDSVFDLIEGSFDLIINGTSASLAGEMPPIPVSVIHQNTTTYDMMYGSSMTVFNRWAEEHGALRTIDGLGMLVEQAAEAFYVWRGVRPQTARVMQSLRNERRR